MRITRAFLLGLVIAGLSACAYYDDYGYGYNPARYGDYLYSGSDYGYPGDPGWVGGSGGDLLDPWLALTQEGREIVALGFDGDDDARITEETAWRANSWFRRYADTDDDLRLTDEEIRLALVQGSRERPWMDRY